MLRLQQWPWERWSARTISPACLVARVVDFTVSKSPEVASCPTQADRAFSTCGAGSFSATPSGAIVKGSTYAQGQRARRDGDPRSSPRRAAIARACGLFFAPSFRMMLPTWK